MEYVIYNKLTDKIYLLYFDNNDWSGALYYYSNKFNLSKNTYIKLLSNNANIEVICEL
jgi:hypothetical protein